MTAKGYWDIMPMKNPHFKINVIEDLALEVLCELAKNGRPRKGILKQLDTIEVEPIPIEELPNPLVTMKMCQRMIHSKYCCNTKIRKKFFTKKNALAKLLIQMNFASEFIGHGAKYLSFKVGNERMVTKRKKAMKDCLEQHKVEITESFEFVKAGQDNLDIPFSYIPFMLFFVAVDFAREMDRKQFGELCNLL